MKKTLLSSSAIAGAALLAAPVATPAFAGTPEVGDNFTVTIGGSMRFSVLAFDQDVRTGRGRGYRFSTDEAEVKFAAGGVADNGLEYGFEMELQTQTNDAANSDETWAYLRGNWGEVNLGDQDDAADRMAIGGEDAMPGRGGYDGAVGDVFNLPTSGFGGPGATFTGDATKATYFSPRFYGFQIGASWTPDTNHAGGAAIADNDTSFENVASGGLNFSEEFNGFGVILAGTVAYSDSPEIVGALGSTVGADVGDAWQWQVGALFSYAGFQLGGAWGGGDNLTATLVNATAGIVADTGQWYDVGLSYSTGPWKVGGGAFWSSAENNGGGVQGPDTDVAIYSIGGNYKVAPGMEIATDVNFVEVDNRNRSLTAAGAQNNDGTVFVFSTIFSF
ncbi:MAG: porin [Alphaproteobacteria bacterium]